MSNLKKTKRKRKRLKSGVIILFFLCVALLGLFLVDWDTLYKQVTIKGYTQFSEIGYNESEILKMTDILDENQLEQALSQDYHEDIVERLTIEHYATLSDLGYDRAQLDVILDQPSTIRDYVVSHPKIEPILTWLDQANLIPERFSRYLSYAAEHPETKPEFVIRLVNANRDKPLYSDVQSTDTSKGILMLVNKYFALESDYIPPDLTPASSCGGFLMVKEAAAALNRLCTSLKDEGIDFAISNTYRSYTTQAKIYNRYLGEDSQANVDRYSARPGHSEHQAGLAVDFKTTSADITAFAGTSADLYLKENAHLFGFIQRYQSGQEILTGYKTESWHYRYVGVEVAIELKASGLTFDEYVALNP